MTPKTVMKDLKLNFFGERLELGIYSDSQGRNVSSKVENICHDKDIRVIGSVMANAGLLQVADTAKGSKDNVVVLLGGTNDILRNELSVVYKKLENTLRNLTDIDKKQVCIPTIPTRYDCDVLDPVHSRVQLLNNYIRELVIRNKNLHLVDLDKLQRFHYTKEGLHLSNRGKLKLSYLIIDAVKKIISKSCVEIHKERLTNQDAESVEMSGNVYKEHVLNNDKTNGKITIVECDMAKIIQKYTNNSKVAFAHCVSGDFRMSAGVAVTFKEHFGKPQETNWTDYSKRIAFSNVGTSAVVYNLITKEIYRSKPNPADYDEAFYQMTQDFIKKDCNILVCSPLGCVRDGISLERFATNIVRFQTTTNVASV